MDQIEEVKQKTNIVNLIGGYLTLKKAGRNYKGLCPFHGEKTPSFMVNEDLQIYKCFGCQAGGDAIKFLMEIEGLEFPEALEKLAEKAGVKLKKIEGNEGNNKKELLAVHSLAAEYYHYLLTKHPAGETARKYLAERGINDKLAETFKLGYALGEWDGLTKYLIGKKKYKRELLIASGLAVQSSKGVFDRFRGRIIFPLLDASGRVVGFTGRVIPGLAREDDAKYLNSPETEIYHKSRSIYGLTLARAEIRKKKRVVLVEGQMDVISSFAAGVAETVGVGGTALTPEMIETLARLTSNFYLAMDADAAGEAAMKRSIEEAEKRGLSIKMVEMVGGKDPDEVARKNPKAWREMVEKAMPVYEFFFNKAIDHYGTDSVEAIGMIVDQVVPYLAKVKNSVVREVWARKLSERVGVNKERVWEEIEKERAGIRIQEPNPPAGGPRTQDKKDGFDGRVFLAALIGAPAETVKKIKDLLVGLPAVEAEGKLLLFILEQGGVGQIAQMIKKLPSELVDLAREVYLIQSEDDLSEKDVIKLAVDWARRMIKNQRTGLSEELRRAEERGEAALLDSLGEKLVKLNALENKLVLW